MPAQRDKITQTYGEKINLTLANSVMLYVFCVGSTFSSDILLFFRFSYKIYTRFFSFLFEKKYENLVFFFK